jgi:hypothetical protein
VSRDKARISNLPIQKWWTRHTPLPPKKDYLVPLSSKNMILSSEKNMRKIAVKTRLITDIIAKVSVKMDLKYEIFTNTNRVL